MKKQPTISEQLEADDMTNLTASITLFKRGLTRIQRLLTRGDWVAAGNLTAQVEEALHWLLREVDEETDKRFPHLADEMPTHEEGTPLDFTDSVKTFQVGKKKLRRRA